MVREWILAEKPSPRTGFRFAHVDDSVANAPLDDAESCRIRAEALGRERGALFVGFPGDIRWAWVELHSDEALCLNYEGFCAFASGSRHPHDIAPDSKTAHARIADYRRAGHDRAQEYDELVRSVEWCAKAIALEQVFRPCIYTVKGTLDSAGVHCAGPLVLLEGAARTIARSWFPARTERALLGVSPTMDEWPWY